MLEIKIGPLGHENRSERGQGYRQYYSDMDAELVKNLCNTDISRFNYQF
jgi:putative component of toxin-antitoxin plasmid stabilization module